MMSGSRTAAASIATLSAASFSMATMSSGVRTPPPTVSGMKQASARRYHDIDHGRALFRGSP